MKTWFLHILIQMPHCDSDGENDVDTYNAERVLSCSGSGAFLVVVHLPVINRQHHHHHQHHHRHHRQQHQQQKQPLEAYPKHTLNLNISPIVGIIIII